MLATVLSLMLLLSAPGPTNTLLFRAGVLFGFRGAWRLVLIEGAAYLLQVSLWGAALIHFAFYSPWVMRCAQWVAVSYLLYVSYQLWQRKSENTRLDRDGFSGRYFFLMTLMNPKGLLIASFIAPADAFSSPRGYLAFMVVLAMVIVPVGATWLLLGSRLERRRGNWLTPVAINRATAVTICCFAAVLLGRLADELIH
ncbi:MULTISPECIES: LysE family translocator [Pseudomonas]|uniref:LysE family translocator n=1 Tax=Pseudomonas TaxID=286 RepID=UPI00064B8823|nr:MULTISPECIES: LysE family transporter [Pseudomonas]MDN6862684.1 LysE family transporter [Pseudomonas rhodesiae]POA62465.1 threonine transporter RhtB [Pseudomonas sp. GW531-R1]